LRAETINERWADSGRADAGERDVRNREDDESGFALLLMTPDDVVRP